MPKKKITLSKPKVGVVRLKPFKDSSPLWNVVKGRKTPGGAFVTNTLTVDKIFQTKKQADAFAKKVRARTKKPKKAKK